MVTYELIQPVDDYELEIGGGTIVGDRHTESRVTATPTHPTPNFGIPDQADAHFEVVFSLCGRSTAAKRNRS